MHSFYKIIKIFDPTFISMHKWIIRINYQTKSINIKDEFFQIKKKSPKHFFFLDCSGDPRVFNHNNSIELKHRATFNGRDHSIVGLKMKTNKSNFGIISKVKTGSKITKLSIVNSVIDIDQPETISNIAFIAGLSNGTIEYCHSINNK